MNYQVASSVYMSSVAVSSYSSVSSSSFSDDSGPPCGCGKGCCAAGAAWRARKGM